MDDGNGELSHAAGSPDGPVITVNAARLAARGMRSSDGAQWAIAMVYTVAAAFCLPTVARFLERASGPVVVVAVTTLLIWLARQVLLGPFS